MPWWMVDHPSTGTACRGPARAAGVQQKQHVEATHVQQVHNLCTACGGPTCTTDIDVQG